MSKIDPVSGTIIPEQTFNSFPRTTHASFHYNHPTVWHCKVCSTLHQICIIAENSTDLNKTMGAVWKYTWQHSLRNSDCKSTPSQLPPMIMPLKSELRLEHLRQAGLASWQCKLPDTLAFACTVAMAGPARLSFLFFSFWCLIYLFWFFLFSFFCFWHTYAQRHTETHTCTGSFGI